MSNEAQSLAGWFAERRESFRNSHLQPGSSEHQQSGWQGSPEEWKSARIVVLDGVVRSGHFLDIGCANGLLLQSLIEWGAERQLEIVPHGIDFVPELVELAKARFPRHQDNFNVANAYDWQPERRYDFVHTLLDYVPVDSQQAYLQRLLDDAVAPGGRLIVSSYGSHDRGERPVDVDLHLQFLRFRTAGCGNGRLNDGWVATRSAWIDR